MSILASLGLRSTVRPAGPLCAASLAFAAVLIPMANAQQTTSLGPSHALEGMQFVGPLGAKGQESPPDDLLTFEDGMFASRTCLQYGFDPVPYWVRHDADGLHFRAELDSPENGTIRFEGVFDGETIHATALWRKPRWYWTVEQTLVFEGRPVDGAR